MEIIIEDLREQIRREERVAGLRPDGFVSDVEIHRRRVQIALVALLVFLALALSTIANDVWTSFRRDSLIDPELVRMAAIALAIGFVAYVLDKERHLKRLSHLGHDVLELDLEIADRMVVRASLADATRAVSASLELDEVLDAFLQQAIQMTGAKRGSVVLLNAGGELRPAAVRNFGDRSGAALLVEESLVLRAALAREPMLMSGSIPLEPTSLDGGAVSSVLCVPFEHCGKPLGAITVGSVLDERFDDADLDLLGQFAAQVAPAVENARRFEGIAMLVDESGGDHVEMSDRLAHLSAVIIDAVSSLRFESLDPRRKAVLLDRIHASGSQLLKIGDALLAVPPRRAD